MFLLKILDFTGRGTRDEYIIATIIIFLIAVFLIFQSTEKYFISYLLFSLYPIYSINIRRMHDINKSGWDLILLFLNRRWIFYVFKPGTDGPNDYGLDPRKK